MYHQNLCVPPKHIIMLHGEPIITWKKSKVRTLIIKENLQYAIVGKISYGKPDINELRKSLRVNVELRMNTV